MESGIKNVGLVLTRKWGERIILKRGVTLTEDVIITMVRPAPNSGAQRIGIKAQKDLIIVREELDKD